MGDTSRLYLLRTTHVLSRGRQPPADVEQHSLDQTEIALDCVRSPSRYPPRRRTRAAWSADAGAHSQSAHPRRGSTVCQWRAAMHNLQCRVYASVVMAGSRICCPSPAMRRSKGGVHAAVHTPTSTVHCRIRIYAMNGIESVSTLTPGTLHCCRVGLSLCPQPWRWSLLPAVAPSTRPAGLRGRTISKFRACVSGAHLCTADGQCPRPNGRGALGPRVGVQPEVRTACRGIAPRTPPHRHSTP